MKRVFVTTLAAAALYATAAWAQCTTNTYFYNGKMVTCTTCCNFGSCTTSCF